MATVMWLGLSCIPMVTHADMVYVSSATTNSISVIDTSVNKMVTTIPVTAPYCTELDPTGEILYVCTSGGGDINYINVIDTNTNNIIKKIPVGIHPVNAAINPSGTRLYVVNRGANTVSAIDTVSSTVLATIPVGKVPIRIAMNAAGTHTYVSNAISNTVSVISTASNAVVSTILVGKYPVGLVASPDGKKLYVANQGEGTVSVVDTQTNTTVKTIPVGSNPTGMAINSVGTNLYVTEMGGSDSVTVIDTITDTVVTKIPVGTGEWPVGAQITPDDKFVYVAYYSSKGSTAWGGDGTTVGVIDTATNTVIATVTVGKGPGDIAIKKTIKCSDQHAVFDPKTGIVSIPAIDIPTLDPFTGESTGKFTVAKAQLSLFKGVEDFAFVNDSFSIISTDVVSSYPCHAQYIYADGKFSKGGTIHLPYVDVPSVIVIPPNTQIPGPVHVYDATLRQLALDSMIFHLADYKSLGTLKQ